MICRARSLSHEFPLSPASPLIPHLLSLRAAETAKRGVVFSVLSLGNHCRIFERGEIWKDYIFEFGNHQVQAKEPVEDGERSITRGCL
ncbi:uncharacterized protein LOC129285925 isoform X2 [Prosopis cineraria]|uniref:uncharacterized protein LOC129285925 isoform X2 n=1 Tax=Prosopis cineraria TaxID=364024 RepID=UPI00240F8F21|nr:uncharacterized protein LOC129285925 isoform X2 [Prosopis cineraria]